MYFLKIELAAAIDCIRKWSRFHFISKSRYWKRIHSGLYRNPMIFFPNLNLCNCKNCAKTANTISYIALLPPNANGKRKFKKKIITIILIMMIIGRSSLSKLSIVPGETFLVMTIIVDLIIKIVKEVKLFFLSSSFSKKLIEYVIIINKEWLKMGNK